MDRPFQPELTLDRLLQEAGVFSARESIHSEPSLYGVTDGKAVGTYLERKFVTSLLDSYRFTPGNSALGIDLPGLEVDIKVTSARKPQSSCPFRSASQKIFGLGYHLLVFVYEKADDDAARTARLNMKQTIFVHKERTADYQTTRGLREILDRDGNEEDLAAFLLDRHLPLDTIEAARIARELLFRKPEQGFLTISNALQWRLQYERVRQKAGLVQGIERIS